uniref:cation channel sperm-associated protein subunit beta n=1 Tax=Jaculus jaculus TaxID=51337 RepID=UPI001E1B2AAA|nr:cation channel sperm-associated protein subunit beta [Jaculus jaculus]
MPDDREKRFACSTKTYSKDNEIIKLFLSTESLKIQCFFQSGSELDSKEMLSVFTSGGLAPNLVIVNSTYSGIFHFNLTLVSDQIFWLIDIPRENITENTDIATVEEWLVRVTLHEGLDIYETEGTLLDVVREPIIQWNLGESMIDTELHDLYPHVVDLKVTKCPCSNDVALMGFVLNSTYNGVYIGMTFSGFWDYNSTSWFDLTSLIYDHLQEEHKGLTVIDMVLTNHFLVILTSLGLFVSSDLRYLIAPNLKLSRADFCGFERVDYIKGKLWYNERCFANREHFEVDYVTITFDRNRTLSESSSCFYSKEPFIDWLPCLPYNIKDTKYMPTVITFLLDQEHNTGIYLLHTEIVRLTTVSVYTFKDKKPSNIPKFPPFHFPNSFSSPIGMVFHPRSHFLYAYGNQVWLSMDGGNSFELIANLQGDYILNTFHSYFTSDITFASKSGMVFFTKAGLMKYTNIGKLNESVVTLYYDHLGFIHKLTPEKFDSGKSTGLGNSKSIFGLPPDLGFETALAPQYITTDEMVFFAYVPKNTRAISLFKKTFRNMHTGKLIQFGKKGKAYIKSVLTHRSVLNFMTSVITNIEEPFGVEDVGQSPCISSTLSIEHSKSNEYILHLDNNNADAVFQDTDVEKTVMIPGYSSFLIISILDPKRALSLATMPMAAETNKTFAAEAWFLYNFGQSNGRQWTIRPRPCQFWFQQLNDVSLSLNLIKYVDVGTSQNFTIKIIHHTNNKPLLEVPPLKIVVGNPTLLEVKSEGSFDESDTYYSQIITSSRLSHQGFTTVAIIVWEASTECYVTTMVPTLKSSCSYLKTMHHIPSTYIPPEDWISGVHKDSQGFNMIKTLPVNYRPPSHMGVAIPLTDNFYHADPSKPIPRNLFYKSKQSGKYKQCANASSRAECNCTNDQKISHAIAFSDCKEKVHRFKFPVSQYPIVLKIFSEEKTIPVKLPYLVTVTEVNMRENWQLKHDLSEGVRKMKNYLEPILHTSVYNPSGLNLSIRGSELFHFRVSVIPGVTFCNLVEEFQIYVDEVPLPFPGHALIAVATAVVLGGFVFTAFIFQLRNIHPLRACQRCLLGNRLTLSNTSMDNS